MFNILDARWQCCPPDHTPLPASRVLLLLSAGGFITISAFKCSMAHSAALVY